MIVMGDSPVHGIQNCTELQLDLVRQNDLTWNPRLNDLSKQLCLVLTMEPCFVTFDVDFRAICLATAW